MNGAKIYEQARAAYAQGNPQEALLLFQRAAAAGHTHALCWMARIYFRGGGIQQNCRMAELLLQQAAAAGDPAARRLLRYMSWKRRQKR
jgi:TPR repeat protein